jgi:hypothetical protein
VTILFAPITKKTGLLVSVCHQPSLICFGVCGRQANIHFFAYAHLTGFPQSIRDLLHLVGLVQQEVCTREVKLDRVAIVERFIAFFKTLENKSVFSFPFSFSQLRRQREASIAFSVQVFWVKRRLKKHGSFLFWFVLFLSTNHGL